MGSTGQSTNAWSQQLGIIGIFDDDRSIWVWRSHEVPSCYHFIILPRETLTHQTHTHWATRPKTSTRGKNALEATHWPQSAPQSPPEPPRGAPSEPNRTPNFPRQR